MKRRRLIILNSDYINIELFRPKIAMKDFKFLWDLYIILQWTCYNVKYIFLFCGQADIATIILRYVYRATRFIALSAMNDATRKNRENYIIKVNSLFFLLLARSKSKSKSCPICENLSVVYLGSPHIDSAILWGILLGRLYL